MCVLEKIFADVEFIRMSNGELKQYDSSVPRHRIRDKLSKSRGYERNLLAVEMKRKGNHKKVCEFCENVNGYGEMKHVKRLHQQPY